MTAFVDYGIYVVDFGARLGHCEFGVFAGANAALFAIVTEDSASLRLD